MKFARSLFAVTGLLFALAFTGCIATGSLLAPEGFPARYVAVLDGVSQARQAAALSVIAGGSIEAAAEKVQELDKIVEKLELDRLVRAVAATPEMAAAKARDNAAREAFEQAKVALRKPSA